MVLAKPFGPGLGVWGLGFMTPLAPIMHPPGLRGNRNISFSFVLQVSGLKFALRCRIGLLWKSLQGTHGVYQGTGISRPLVWLLAGCQAGWTVRRRAEVMHPGGSNGAGSGLGVGAISIGIQVCKMTVFRFQPIDWGASVQELLTIRLEVEKAIRLQALPLSQSRGPVDCSSSTWRRSTCVRSNGIM